MSDFILKIAQCFKRFMSCLWENKCCQAHQGVPGSVSISRFSRSVQKLQKNQYFSLPRTFWQEIKVTFQKQKIIQFVCHPETQILLSFFPIETACCPHSVLKVWYSVIWIISECQIKKKEMSIYFVLWVTSDCYRI